MAIRIEYKESVEKELRKIDPSEVDKIINKIERQLRKKPNKGEALKGRYKGLFKIRVGDYRVIFAKTQRGFLILRISHRKHVY